MITTRTKRYRIEGLNITDGVQVFTDGFAALDVIQQKQAEQVASEEWVFHVQAKCPKGDGVHTLHNCDLDGDGIFDHEVNGYQVFNHTTGQYEHFDAFEPAKRKCEELRLARFIAVYDSYHLLEEVQQTDDLGETVSEWHFCNVGDTIRYKHE